MSKVVFVGNVPYNMAEEQLIDVFKSVGHVVGLRLVFDRDTGKPKGYGFCEFADHETAASAVRNLNGQEIGGRPLRIDLADSDPFLEGKTTVRGEIIDGGETRAQWRERNERERQERERPGGDHDRHGRSHDPKYILQQVPKGKPLPPGSNASDAITHVLATAESNKILEVLAHTKAFIITHPEESHALLSSNPQLGYALFQALLLHNIVDSAILDRMLAATGAAVPARAPAPPPVQPQHSAPPPFMPASIPPPTSMYGAPPIPPSHTPMQHPTPPLPPYGQPPPYYRGPPPPLPSVVQSHPSQMPPAMHPPPPAQPTGMPDLDAAQMDMLNQVLSLTQDQLNTLPPNEREAILDLRRKFGVGS